MEEPKISVCVATYNGAKYIKQQLDSILRQLKASDEVIVSDDGSTDGTLDIIKSMGDSRIKVYAHKKDKDISRKYLCSFYFASYNFENAIRHATGSIIYLADQDDVWADGRVDKTLPCMTSCDILMCNYSVIDGRGNLLEKAHLKGNPVRGNLLWDLWKIPFKGCCMTLRKEALDKALPFPRDCINHDTWIGLALMHHGCTFRYVGEPLHLYRAHTSNVSSAVGKSPNSLFFKVKYRMRILWQMLTYRP